VGDFCFTFRTYLLRRGIKFVCELLWPNFFLTKACCRVCRLLNRNKNNAEEVELISLRDDRRTGPVAADPSGPAPPTPHQAFGRIRGRVLPRIEREKSGPLKTKVRSERRQSLLSCRASTIRTLAQRRRNGLHYPHPPCVLSPPFPTDENKGMSP
jgi:hypothetical protein